MHFARTEEQDELAAIVAALLDKHSDSAAVAPGWSPKAAYDESLWRALCEQVGVAALPIPEEYDGFGASLVETAVVLEELGHNLAPTPLLATAIATAAVLVRGTRRRRRRCCHGSRSVRSRPWHREAGARRGHRRDRARAA